jgi:hypothetical protein
VCLRLWSRLGGRRSRVLAVIVGGLGVAVGCATTAAGVSQADLQNCKRDCSAAGLEFDGVGLYRGDVMCICEPD